MASIATSAGTFRRLLSRFVRPAAPSPPIAFFQPCCSSFRSPAFFSPSRRSLPFPARPYSQAASSSPSSIFLALRTAFRRPQSASPAARRTFGTSALVRGIRPYYGRARNGGGYGRRPPPSWKDRINEIPHAWVMGGLIVLNVSVFAAWQYGEQLAVRFRDASWLRFLHHNFTVSWQNVSQGRIWTLVTSAFSHEGTGHLLVNMASLFFMAPPVMAVLGNVGFLSLYLLSGLAASAFSLAFNHFVTKNPNYAAHGASGATYGTISFFACMFPTTTFLLFFVVPVPAWLCVRQVTLSGIFVWDLYGAMTRRSGMTDSAGHVGGITAGILFFLRLIGRV
ncbi:hypothetical protein JCM21900_003056 [Sporobolomyces salmonicolor]